MATETAARAQITEDLLNERKSEVEQAFESQKSTRSQLEQQTNETAKEMLRLEGEYRCLEGLDKTLKDKK